MVRENDWIEDMELTHIFQDRIILRGPQGDQELWLSYFLVELLKVFLLPSDVKDGSADLTVAFRGLSTARPAHFLPFLYLLLKGTTSKDAAHTIG